jgi:hypothetical protein
MRKNWPVRAVKILLIAAVALPLFGFLVMSLWNWLMPTLFLVPRLTLAQALGIFLLSRILFGGFGGDGGRRYSRRRMMHRWEQMTPEEREQFRCSVDTWSRRTERAAPDAAD